MKGFSVLFGMTLLLAIAAMSAGGSGVRDQIDPELTSEVEAMLELHPLERSPLREFAGLPPRTADPAPDPIPGRRGRGQHRTRHGGLRMNRLIGGAPALLLLAATAGYAMLILRMVALEIERARRDRTIGGWPALQRNRIDRRRHGRAAW